MPVSGLWSGAIASFGLIFMIFFGFKSGFATATEISAFAVAYALVVGSVVFRELSFRSAAHSFVQARDARGARAVHRCRRAVAGVHADLAAGAACGRRFHAGTVQDQRHLAVHAARDRAC